MKQPRPSMRDIVRPPRISDFIETGEIPPAPVAPDPETGPEAKDSSIRVTVPPELYEAFLLKVSERGLALPEAVREMFLDYLMKES
jgi:hypothetical protein